LCPEHFIAACCLDLNGLADRLQQERFQNEARESVKRELQECLWQASALAQKGQDLAGEEQISLIEVLFWGAELGQRLRRGPRKAASIPVRLRRERPGEAWEEDTKTLLLSRYGALIACPRAVQVGETLHLTRLDIGQQAQARVTWVRGGPGPVQIGVEFLEQENFWGLKWEGAETVEPN